MKIDVLTLFPEFFDALKAYSIVGRALERGVFSFSAINIRDFSKDKHKRVDDYPFGGGPGMVMKPEPIYDALLSIKNEDSYVIYLSPQGNKYNQEMAKMLSNKKHIILLCGHYEGIDNRIIENCVDMELSIGDYVLTGGEIPAMVIVDSIVRLLPGVLSSEESYIDESHYNGLLEYPQYTRPREFNGLKVPDILLSGNHEKIDKWRKYQSLRNTYLKRPDLLKKRHLSKEEIDMLEEIKKLI